jgi:uncharacterized protein YkwD
MLFMSKILFRLVELAAVASMFAVNAQAATLSYPLNFTIGWNLLGNSVDTPITVNQIFNDKNTFNTIWKWNPSTSKWAFYTPANTDGGAAYATLKGYEFLSTINPGEGFWVNAKVNATSAPAMTQTGNSFLLGANSLLPNWNLIATGTNLGVADFNRSLSGVLSGIPANVTTLWAWDAANQKWYFYSPALDATPGSLATYIQGKGYEDFTSAGITLGNGKGFWVNYPSNAAGSVIDNELKFFNALNTTRSTLGLAQLNRDSSLDRAATAHANYLNLNADVLNPIMGQVDPSTGILYGHSEDTGNPGFLAATPQARDVASGYSGVIYDEILTFGGNSAVNADGTDAFNGLMNTVYHRIGMLQDNLCDIGVGSTSGTNFVADMGCKVNTPSLASGTLVVFPADGQVDPYPYWEVGLEVPNPLPLLANGTPVGGPISVTARTGDVLVTDSFSLTQNGNAVSSQVITLQNDNLVPANNVFLIPLAPLQLGVSYSANFNGSVNGVPVTKAWGFTTPVSSLNASPTGPLTMKNGQTLAISMQAPSGNPNWRYSTTIPLSDIQILFLSSNKLMVTVASTTLTRSGIINLTLSDEKISSVPQQTIQITVTP